MFSRSCEYALQAVLYITLHNSNKAVGLTAIAKSQKIPAHFLSKILQLLVKNKIRQLLSEKTVAELCEDVKNGSTIVNLKG